MGSCIEKKVGRAQGHSEVPLSSSRALPMSPGLPASKFLALALRHHPTCREDQGDEASIGERPGLDSSPLYLLEVFCGLPDDVKR
jgi:hypothetical protein